MLSRSVVSDSLRPMDCSPPDTSVHGDSPDKNSGMGCHALLQGIFPTQLSHISSGFFTSWANREAQEYWSVWPIPSPGDLPDPGIELGSSALQLDSLPAELPGKLQSPWRCHLMLLFHILSLWTCSFMTGDSSGLESLLHKHFKYYCIHPSLKETWGMGSGETAKYIIF